MATEFLMNREDRRATIRQIQKVKRVNREQADIILKAWLEKGAWATPLEFDIGAQVKLNVQLLMKDEGFQNAPSERRMWVMKNVDTVFTIVFNSQTERNKLPDTKMKVFIKNFDIKGETVAFAEDPFDPPCQFFTSYLIPVKNAGCEEGKTALLKYTEKHPVVVD